MVVVGQFAMLEGSANRLDTEQEREQEQEQEKEVEARRDKQIEVEKFVDREYSRQEEVQRPWPFTMLSRPISTTEEHPFYSLSDFKLRHQEPLEFSDGLYVSTNYFNPKWTGLRRVKNVIMVCFPFNRPIIFCTHLHFCLARSWSMHRPLARLTCASRQWKRCRWN
jgi:hypothetical protein